MILSRLAMKMEEQSRDISKMPGDGFLEFEQNWISSKYGKEYIWISPLELSRT